MGRDDNQDSEKRRDKQRRSAQDKAATSKHDGSGADGEPSAAQGRPSASTSGEEIRGERAGGEGGELTSFEPLGIRVICVPLCQVDCQRSERAEVDLCTPLISGQFGSFHIIQEWTVVRAGSMRKRHLNLRVTPTIPSRSKQACCKFLSNHGVINKCLRVLASFAVVNSRNGVLQCLS